MTPKREMTKQFCLITCPQKTQFCHPTPFLHDFHFLFPKFCSERISSLFFFNKLNTHNSTHIQSHIKRYMLPNSILMSWPTISNPNHNDRYKFYKVLNLSPVHISMLETMSFQKCPFFTRTGPPSGIFMPVMSFTNI